MTDVKQNCWEFKACGREPGGSKVSELGPCRVPTETAADGLNGGKNGGRICWVIAGTLCGGKAQGSFAKKILSCMTCEFFNKVEREEGIYEFLILRPEQEVDHP